MLIGIRTPHPMIVKMEKMFLIILVNRMKIAASSPSFSTISGSFVLLTVPIHPNNPLLTGGGACFESAYFARGA